MDGRPKPQPHRLFDALLCFLLRCWKETQAAPRTRSCAPDFANVAAFLGIPGDASGQTGFAPCPRTSLPAHSTRLLPYSRLLAWRPSLGAPTPDDFRIDFGLRQSFDRPKNDQVVGALPGFASFVSFSPLERLAVLNASGEG